MSSQKYTMLSDLEPENSHATSQGEIPQVSKFIRGGRIMQPMESGMSPMGGMHGGGSMGGGGMGNMPPMQDGMSPEMMQQMMQREISCIEIAKHIQNCPICSKFYNCDTNIYIISIVILCVICLMLLKRVLNV